MKKIVFRFDVDTPRCIGAGMKALNRLSRELDAPFVYFVNFGRSVDLSARTARPAAESDTPIAKLGALRKQGVLGIAGLLLRNPRLVDIGADSLREADSLGCELGVHGGRNHASWQWGYSSWDAARIRDEVDWSTRTFRQLLGRDPAGFSSPGWTSDDRLAPILEAAGYRYFADRHGVPGHRDAGSLRNYTTLLTGEPGGVGFLESCIARGLSDADVLAIFDEAAEQAEEPLVIYDHPCFAGDEGLPLLSRLAEHARARGWAFSRFDQLMDAAS